MKGIRLVPFSLFRSKDTQLMADRCWCSSCWYTEYVKGERLWPRPDVFFFQFFQFFVCFFFSNKWTRPPRPQREKNRTCRGIIKDRQTVTKSCVRLCFNSLVIRVFQHWEMCSSRRRVLALFSLLLSQVCSRTWGLANHLEDKSNDEGVGYLLTYRNATRDRHTHKRKKRIADMRCLSTSSRLSITNTTDISQTTLLRLIPCP